MNIIEAAKAAIEGKQVRTGDGHKVRREGYGHNDSYKLLIYEKVDTWQKYKLYGRAPLIKDILATDYEVVEDQSES